MNSDEKCIELRIPHTGNPYVAVLGGCCPRYGFQRIFNPFFSHRDRLGDGRQEQVHLLPDANLVYEIEEVRDGKRVRWHCVTVEGDPKIHRISRYGALMVAREEMPIRKAIREYPEMPPITLDEE